ncbi:hypothetical protein D9M68_353330 [compost metagenome]
MSLLVPVFTAVQKRVDRMLSSPKVRVRAFGSDRMSPTMKAARGSSSGAASAGLALVAGAGRGASGVSVVAPKRPPLATMR